MAAGYSPSAADGVIESLTGDYRDGVGVEPPVRAIAALAELVGALQAFVREYEGTFEEEYVDTPLDGIASRARSALSAAGF